MKNLSFIVIVFTLLSCQPIAKVLVGFKNPKIETPKTVKDYIIKNNLSAQDNFVVKDKSSYKTVLNLFYKTIPEAVLFDKDGNELIYKETAESCNAGLFKVIPDLNKNSQLKNGSQNLNDILFKYTLPLDGKPIQIKDDSDYYLLVDWAIFAGKLNKDHVLAWENLAKGNKNCKIKVIKLNIDFQDNWGLTENDIKK